ncbi:SH3 domain-containing protein [Fredinandcohnia humi]
MLHHKILKVLLAFVVVVVYVSSEPMLVIKAEQTAIINTSVLNVREGPGLSYALVSQVKQDEKYTILEKKNDWVKLELSSGKTGWVASWLIKEESTNSTPPATQTGSSSTIVSTVDGLRLRNGPGTGFQVIGSLNNGNEAEFLENRENWSKVSYKGQIGWVASEYIKTKSATNDPNPKPTTNKTGKITASVLNVRGEPNLQGRIVGKLLEGASVKIVAERENWIEISFGSSTAWIHRDFVTTSSSSETPETPEPTPLPQKPVNEGKTGIVTASSLNVRDSGSLSGKVIGSLKQGDQVTIEEEVNNWSKITLSNGSKGWIASWYLEVKADNSTPPPTTEESSVKILYNGTNIRTGPATTHPVAARANEGDTFTIIKTEGDWYKITLPDNKIGYVAGWIVSVDGVGVIVERPGVNQYLKGKTIVVDPGHGGNDSGAVGATGTFEKEITLRTARIVFDKLSATGANVILTRNSDSYISLRSRVSISHYRNADAFISIHYDSTADRSARGITSYYYKNIDIPLASSIQAEMIRNTGFKNRQHRLGNFQVIRENRNPSALLELGFLSNPTEEYTVNTNSFQENVSNGIFYGLAQYFKGR